MIQQVIFDTAELLYRKGVRHVVLSPGSRNAPLTISFARHPYLKVYSIVDERSAGFIALGIAQRTQQPVVICCTSGSALLNYLPAVAEAYYQGIPLLILSADRPPEWMNQRDGQTINQSNVADNFTKGFFQMPTDLGHADDAQWEYNRKLNEAVNLSIRDFKGPVHINIPFREPFYPDASQELSYSKHIRLIDSVRNTAPIAIPEEKVALWKNSRKKLVVIGQLAPEEGLADKLIQFSKDYNIPIVTDIISNLNDPSFIRFQDHYLGKLSKEQAKELNPDLVISFGRSVISKNLKLFLRRHRPDQHWHVEPTDHISDTFKSLTWHCFGNIQSFINAIADLDTKSGTHFASYHQAWNDLESTTQAQLTELEDAPFSEYKASFLLAKAIPSNYALHLANSMPVRYANLLRCIDPAVEIYANRGTSGIDGSNGVAVGDSLVNEKSTLLWSGDLAFFYDRNAFFHHHDLLNLRIVVINNEGGGIFRLINGPGLLPELEEYFETRHKESAKQTAKNFNFEYHVVSDEESLNSGLKALFKKKKGPKILEIFTEPSINQEVYNKIKNLKI